MRGIKHPLKPRAIALRKKGLSIGQIETMLQIRRSTLSAWFQGVVLTKNQQEKLLQDWRNGLVKARRKAVLWHHAEKKKRLQQAEKEAKTVLATLNTSHKGSLELALAMLYLGEGFKATIGLGIGNSNPMILRFFIAALSICYGFDKTRIKCELHLRADQDPTETRKYWAHALGVSSMNFTATSIDKRTAGTQTYPTYKGVCTLRCGSAAIQRRLMFLGTMFCEKVIADRRA